MGAFGLNPPARMSATAFQDGGCVDGWSSKRQAGTSETGNIDRDMK